jgi:hypothetical protein
LNRVLIRRWGIYTRNPVVVWRNPLSQDQVTVLTSREVGVEHIYRTNHNGLFSYFVQGAPAYLTSNICPIKGLANGTQVKLHSLTWPENAPVATYLARIACAAPGEEVYIEIPPITINVQIPLSDREIQAWPREQTIVSNAVVIPVKLSTRDPTKLHVCVNSTWLPIKVRTHAIELGFAITFHKVQGKTLPRIILDLNNRPFKPQITFNMLLVGLSRVTSGQNFRILPLQPNASLEYLTNLKPDPLLSVWMAGFDTNGIWHANLATEHQMISNRTRSIVLFSII